MSNTSVELFLQETMILSKTMVIKHQEVAEQINAELRMQYPNLFIDDNRPETWKYYLNLAGEYHITDLEELRAINGDGNPYMTIKVAGENEAVVTDFTKELMSGVDADVALATEYAYGSNFYRDLTARYPNFEQLILGILNPIDIGLAIKSYNGDILYGGGYYRVLENNNPDTFYFEERVVAGATNKTLVESNESTLLFRLEEWVKNTIDQWLVKDYIVGNDLYVAAVFMGMWAKLPIKIFNLRLENIKSLTGETHSFHVREFLNSHGDLGKYLPYLTLQQAMYLYKNMGWLEANFGKEEVFDALVENLLTPAGVPIAAYLLKQNLYDLTTDLHSEPYMERNFLNLRSIGGGSDARSIEEIVNKSIHLARDNGLYIEDQIREITEMARRSRFDVLKTKVLESDMQDSRDSIQYPKAAFLLNQWLYTVTYGKYRGSIFVTHPTTGQRLQFTPRNAFILMYYCYAKGFCEYDLKTFPELKALIIPKNDNPPYDFLEKFPTKEQLKWYYSSPIIDDKAISRLQSGVKPTFSYNSTMQFNMASTEQHKQLMRRWTQAMQYEDLRACGQFEWLVNKHYWFHVDCGKLTNLTMEEWLKNMGLDLEDLTTVDYRNLASDLIRKGTGVTEHDGDWLSEMQGAVLDILQYFSSYTIQIIKTFRQGNAIRAGFKSLRLGDETYKAEAIGKIKVTNIEVVDVKDYGYSERVHVGIRRNTNFRDVYGYQKVKIGLPHKKYEKTSTQLRQRVEIAMRRLRVTDEYKIPPNFTLQYLAADKVTPNIMYGRAVGLEFGEASMRMDNPFVNYYFNSEKQNAIEGYQAVNIDVTNTVEDIEMKYLTEELYMASAPIGVNIMHGLPMGLEAKPTMTAGTATKTEYYASKVITPDIIHGNAVGVEMGNAVMEMEFVQAKFYHASEIIPVTLNAFMYDMKRKNIWNTKTDGTDLRPIYKSKVASYTYMASAEMFGQLGVFNALSNTADIASFTYKFFGNEIARTLIQDQQVTVSMVRFKVDFPTIYVPTITNQITSATITSLKIDMLDVKTMVISDQKVEVSLNLLTIG